MSEQDQDNQIVDNETELAHKEVDSPLDNSAIEPEDITPTMPVKGQLAILAVLLFGIFSLGATPFVMTRLGSDQNVGAVSGSVLSGENGSRNETADLFSELNILAKSTLVFDVRDEKILYEQDTDLVWPLASVTKLMTVLLSSELVESDELVTVTAEAVAQDGDSGLSAGEVFYFSDLSDLTILTSSNDGAYALAYAAGLKLDVNDPASAFVKAMNIRAKELGMTDTYFRNPTGLDLEENESGAYGTAEDMVRLLRYILENQPEVLEKTTVLRGVIYNVNGELHQVANTNTVVNAIPGLIGSKTGYTTLSGGNLVIAFDAGIGHQVIVVVLGSTHQGRLSDVLQLVEATRASFQ